MVCTQRQPCFGNNHKRVLGDSWPSLFQSTCIFPLKSVLVFVQSMFFCTWRAIQDLRRLSRLFIQVAAMQRVCVALFGGAAALDHAPAAPIGVGAAQPQVLSLYENGTAAVDDAFQQVFNHFAKTFDYDTYDALMEQFGKGADAYKQTEAYTSYRTMVPHCDKGGAPASIQHANVHGVSAFPGGIVGRVFGFEFGKSLYDLSQGAEGPAAAGLLTPLALSSQALTTGMGLVQSALASALHVVPPLVPPPAWNNQPLTCAPMISGHNCFGAVLYPITMADFMVADVTDSMLDGYIASFPSMYARKVGKTDDAMYEACFSSYMSMLCSSMFPRCTTPQSRDEMMPVGGRVPMCLHMCLLPLVMCPGLWMEDLMGSCSLVSVPPLCTQASFGNTWRLPPQYADFNEANPYPRDCPRVDGDMDADSDPSLYDEAEPAASPIETAAAAIKG